MRDRDALITGIGLVSCLGEGLAQHWAALSQGRRLRPARDERTYAPYAVHTLAPLDWDAQIPKRGDQRQMEAWQRTGVFAAGLALADAGLRGNAAMLARADMIVAAGGGERDLAVDEAVLARVAAEPDRHGEILNTALLSDLRPTLFLAQLANLLAGNIAIVHGVTGGSRTLMGEESAGADAVRIACARIGAGQGELFLVGGSYNAQRLDGVLPYALGGTLRAGPHAGVFSRADAPGLDMASGGCFLVIESRAHAEARGAAAHARIASVATDRCARAAAAEVTASLKTLIAAVGGAADGTVSAATGMAPVTDAEAAALPDGPVRAIGTAIGHLIESAFPAAIGLAALALRHTTLWPPLSADERESGRIETLLVTGCGHWRGEFAARLEAASLEASSLEAGRAGAA